MLLDPWLFLPIPSAAVAVFYSFAQAMSGGKALSAIHNHCLQNRRVQRAPDGAMSVNTGMCPIQECLPTSILGNRACPQGAGGACWLHMHRTQGPGGWEKHRCHWDWTPATCCHHALPEPRGHDHTARLGTERHTPPQPRRAPGWGGGGGTCPPFHYISVDFTDFVVTWTGATKTQDLFLF